MNKYYKNITNFTKKNIKLISTLCMIAIAVVCVMVIDFSTDEAVMANTQEENYSEMSADYIEAAAAVIETRVTQYVKTAFEKTTTEAVTLESTVQQKKKTAKAKSKVYKAVNENAYVIYNVNVRDNANGNKVGYLEAGDKVKRTAVGNNGWSQIEYEGKKAYVYTYYLTTNKAAITKGIQAPKVESASINKSGSNVDNALGLFISEEDYTWLLKIVQAEAGNQDEKGRILVANTIINRVKSSTFPNTITNVVFQKAGGVYQFSPVKNGSIYSVNVDQTTINCVNRALNGENYSSEVLYFSSEHNPYSWHNTSLAYLFTYGAHAFYR